MPEDAAALVTAAVRVHGEALIGAVHLGGLGVQAAAPGEARRHGVSGALHLLQALARAGLRNPPRLWLVTAGVQRPAGDTACDPAQAPVWGLGRTAAHEHPDLRPSLADLPIAPAAADIDALARMLRADGRKPSCPFAMGAFSWHGWPLPVTRSPAGGRSPCDATAPI
jgi:hypothetical protein